MDIVDVVASPQMQGQFTQAGITKPRILEQTEHRWLGQLGWCAFVEHWRGYESHFHLWDNDRNPQSPARHANSAGAPKPKGEGQSLMVSDFLTTEWGHLHDEQGADNLLAQVECAIEIFEWLTNRTTQALFGWTHHSSGPRMCDGRLPNGNAQLLYFLDDHPSMPSWFKGMEQIICEHGLWPEGGLVAQCLDFKCPPGCTDCCCCWLLFTQADFIGQKSQREELIERHGHLCDFYPKYHCELNFIEQYWGAVKAQFHEAGQAKSIKEMEQTVIQCLDSVTLLQIWWFANQAACFILAYGEGLSGAQATWANRRYHGHHTLPPEMIAAAKAS
ncbi:hypothetical protein BJV78DRAFT_1277445 [Lactifluus subvellereus]|nr:hypothetical protein BJV78DRAFT_1277445 [Lactifluus subvellereus]